MQIQINTDHNIEGNQELATQVRDIVAHELDRFSGLISRVEVHLSDQSGTKSDNDKRCVIEARIRGRKPTAVTHEAVTLDQAVRGAAEKLQRSLQHTVERLHDRR